MVKRSHKWNKLCISTSLMADDCNGCAVCLLSCPVWSQTHDQRLTFCGRMRSMQGGAKLEELAGSVNACILCGSCEPVCSYGVESVMRTIEMRSLLSGQIPPPHLPVETFVRARGRVLLANSTLASDSTMIDKTIEHLGGRVAIHPDSGGDISEALVAGMRIDNQRLQAFFESISGASEIITTDSLIFRLILRFLPDINAVPLGRALLESTRLRNDIGPGDMYVIDAASYNADFAHLVSFYDSIRRITGIMMNLDLHRVATPSGVLPGSQRGVVDPVRQAEWILKGRPANRIIVERLEDAEIFRAVSKVPVFFVSEIGL